MRAAQRTLAIVALLILVTQTVRHAYLLWLEPRGSVLDKYDQPLKGEIAEAASLDSLLARYDKVRREVEVANQERSKKGQPLRFEGRSEQEPYKSERMLREAIEGWESKSKEIHSVRFYWIIGLVLSVLGLFISRRWNRWFGLSLLIAGFSEIIYWTSPTFLGSTTREFERLLVHKFTLSLVSLALLVTAILFLKVFADDGRASGSRGKAA